MLPREMLHSLRRILDNTTMSHFRWVAALLIASALVLPFNTFSSLGPTQQDWLIFGNDYADPMEALPFLWPLITAYCGSQFTGWIVTAARLLAELCLLPWAAISWFELALFFASPAIGGHLSAIGIIAYFVIWILEVGGLVRGLVRRVL